MSGGKISFSWDVHWACNYRCPYCWWHGRWDELGKRNRYPGAQALAAIWKKIFDRYGEAHIEMLGGEPLLYPDFFAFLEELLGWHTVGITTNLSVDLGPFLQALPPEKRSRLCLSATFHPLFAKKEAFMAGIDTLRRNGMKLAVLYCAYPPQVGDIPKYKKEFSEAGVTFSVLTFWGKYDGRDYPQSYSPEEIAVIDAELGKRGGEKFQIAPVITKGKPCNAGHRYGIIHPDGEVFRCGGGGVHGENVRVGNLFDEDFALFDGPRPCHSEYCPCNKWAFLLDGK